MLSLGTPGKLNINLWKHQDFINNWQRLWGLFCFQLRTNQRAKYALLCGPGAGPCWSTTLAAPQKCIFLTWSFFLSIYLWILVKCTARCTRGRLWATAFSYLSGLRPFEHLSSYCHVIRVLGGSLRWLCGEKHMLRSPMTQVQFPGPTQERTPQCTPPTNTCLEGRSALGSGVQLSR